jgi:hypothetical protein
MSACRRCLQPLGRRAEDEGREEHLLCGADVRAAIEGLARDDQARGGAVRPIGGVLRMAAGVDR